MKNRKVIAYSFIVAMGGLLFGLDTAVISGAEKSIQQLFQLTDWWHGFTVAIALIGTVFGALAAGWPSEKYGRKKVLIAIAIIYGLSALGCALAPSWLILVISRFLGGLGIGASSVIGPMYIAEIAPPNLRGRLVALFQFNVVTGIFLAFLSNYLLADSGENAWRWMLGVVVFPSFVFLILLFIIPDSPRWLVKHRRSKDAHKVLELCGRTNIEAEINEIEESLHIQSNSPVENLFSRKYRRPILYAVLLAAFKQLSGINAIMYYAPRIFEMTGLGTDASLLQSVMIGVTNLVFTIVAMFIIDRFGRKTLLITGSFGMIVFLALVARAFYLNDFNGWSVMWYLVGYIAFFGFSQGAVIWVFISEIFPNTVRSKGQTLGSFTHWFGAAAISWTFPVAANNPAIGGGNAFMFFSVMMLLHLIFAWKVIPETKGKSLEQIQKNLGIS
ncbi:MAG: sugar porter family MFS transporter [Bacteroidales bacterium]|nr:sugar porter family MFS transporter [Bacteroidales bacterium]